MPSDRLVKISRYLSKHLRHQPERLGLTLAPGGWVAIDDLLAACAADCPISRAELEAVVASSDKQRFAIDPTGTRIRANQGHSVSVDLQLEPQSPPATLYHGTSETSIEAILQTGLQKMARHHVHLSADLETARRVGEARAAHRPERRCGSTAPSRMAVLPLRKSSLASRSRAARIPTGDSLS